MFSLVRKRFPRTRGDGSGHSTPSFPRTRGDGSDAAVDIAEIKAFSPYTRGLLTAIYNSIPFCPSSSGDRAVAF